jgi:hypothetical protein
MAIGDCSCGECSMKDHTNKPVLKRIFTRLASLFIAQNRKCLPKQFFNYLVNVNINYNINVNILSSRHPPPFLDNLKV